MLSNALGCGGGLFVGLEYVGVITTIKGLLPGFNVERLSDFVSVNRTPSSLKE